MRMTKAQIAAKLGTDEAGIAQALDDLMASLDEELERRLMVEAELKATREQLRVATLSASLALSQASQAEADVRRAAQLIRAAHQAPHPARRAKTRRRM